jgi:Cytochrome P460
VRRLLLLALVSAAGAVSACGGEDDRAAEPTTSEAAPPATTTDETTTAEQTTSETTTETEPPPPEAPPGAPRLVAGYRDWVKLNDEPIPPREADPHNGTKNVYASKERRPNGRFPAGTIVVKEASRPGKDFIGLIATMRKEPGADPAHENWVFVEYARESRNQRFQEIGRGAVCWSCHIGALESDYVFTE